VIVDPQVAMDKLTGLGSSQAIADYLAVERVLGILATGQSCPVAVYLQRVTGQVPLVGIGSWHPNRFDIDRPWYPHSDPVRAFIRDFDAGCYPELTTLYVHKLIAAIAG